MTTRIVKHLDIHNFKSSWKALLVLVVGILITAILTLAVYRDLESEARMELAYVSTEIGLKIDARLHAHAVILRAGAAHFAVSDTVTRDDWEKFVELSRLDINLPGTQGLGYSVIIPPDKLQEHIEQVQQEGFPGYKVFPEGERDFYTSIVFLEPFSGRNLKAFGYDMYSEPVRRKAMQMSCDNNVAMLSGKVGLVQETNEDVQAGTLMYVPSYEPGMPANTVKERRAAIKGMGL